MGTGNRVAGDPEGTKNTKNTKNLFLFSKNIFFVMLRVFAPSWSPATTDLRACAVFDEMKRVSLIVVAALVLVASVGVAVRMRSRAAAMLPLLPDLSGQPPAVVEHLRSADAQARRHPASADAVGALGIAYHADLFYGAAAEAYRSAAILAPDDWRWQYLLALLHLERGEAEPAASLLRAITAANPTMALAWLRLGDAEFKRARYNEADEAYGRAEAGNVAAADPPGPLAARRETIPVGAYAALGRARVALQQARAERAKESLEKLVAAAPRLGVAHRLLGDAYQRLGQNDKAARHVARAAALPAYNAAPDPMVDALARESRSSVLLLKQASAADPTRDSAWREYLIRRALEFDAANPDVVYEMGALLQQLKRPREALPYFERHLDMVSDDQQTLVQIGKCYSDLAQYPAAEATLRRAIALADDAVGEYNLGYVLDQVGRTDEAERQYQRALALNPGLAAAHTNLGAALAARGQFSDAVTHLAEAVRLEPGNAAARNNLGALFLQQRQVENAAREFRLALELNPGHADAHANLGSALAQQGAYDEALRQFDEALRIDPRHRTAGANRQAVLARLQEQGRR
jgi:tetratricopeptide (TPR) repeat protein